jgi:hypothetical protein
MAVVATGSKYNRNTGYIMMAACLAIAGWFLYDGWFNKNFQEEHTVDGKPDISLQLNRTWIPIVAVLVGLYKGFSSVRIKSKRVVADEEKITIDTGKSISYSDVTQIDKRFFEKEGYFVITFKEDGAERTVKLSDRNYDNLGMVLDEVVRCTGAAPVEAEEPEEEKKENS